MKCPKCGHEVKDGYKFCSKCGTKMNGSAPSGNSMYSNSSSRIITPPAYGESRTAYSSPNPAPQHSGDEIVKNKAVWSLNIGEVARHIKESEFAQCDTLSGIIIEDGVEAIISVDSNEVAHLKHGLYNFVETNESVRIKQQFIPHREGGLVGAAKKAWDGIVNLILGKKVEGGTSSSANDGQRRLTSAEELIRRMTANSIFSAYLKLDREFPVLFGSVCGMSGKPEFRPVDIRTKYVDVKVGVSMFLQIYDAKAFLGKYLVGRKILTAQDIQEELTPYVREVLQRELADCDMEGNQIPADVRDRIVYGLMNLTGVMDGLKVVRVTEVTAQNQDLERFRQLATEMYMSEKELDFLIRTNEFKNRLSDEVNAQKVREARGLYEQHLALQELNRDKLLSDDEMRKFEEELQTRILDRNNNTEAERLSSLSNLAMRKIDIASKVEEHKLKVDADLADAEFEKYRRQRNVDMKTLEVEEALYGRQYLAQKQHLADAIEMDSIQRGYMRQTEMDDARHQGDLLREQLGQRGLLDDYEDKRADIEFGRKVNQVAQMQDLAHREENLHIDQMERKQSVAFRGMADLARLDQEMEEAEHRRAMEHEDATHRREMEGRMEDHNFELTKERMAHEERVAAQEQNFQIRMTEQENFTRMSAEQIAASQLRDLDSHQAEAFKGVYGSQRDVAATERILETERRAAEAAARTARDMVAISENARNDSRQDMKEMMGMFMNQMQAQQAMQQQFMQQRIDDTREMKQEYREEMHRNQSRIDANQQQALDYTTQVTKADKESGNTTIIVEEK